MPKRFRVITTSVFERSARKIIKHNTELARILRRLVNILEQDPYNRSRQYNIKKLLAIKPGDGQWRIRIGDYRLRYDIFGQDIVLHTFRDRKGVY